MTKDQASQSRFELRCHHRHTLMDGCPRCIEDKDWKPVPTTEPQYKAYPPSTLAAMTIEAIDRRLTSLIVLGAADSDQAAQLRKAVRAMGE